MPALLRLAVEAGPLLVFFVVNGRGGLSELHALFGVAGGHAQQGLFDATAAFELDDAGWRALTLRWGLFFVLLAALNEIVWRLFETETWIAFKLFGVLPLTVIFALAQTPLLLRHRQDGGDKAAPR